MSAVRELTFSTTGNEKHDVKESPKEGMREPRSPRNMSLYEHNPTNGRLSIFAKVWSVSLTDWITVLVSWAPDGHPRMG